MWKKVKDNEETAAHEDSHLRPSMPSNPPKLIRGVRCLGRCASTVRWTGSLVKNSAGGLRIEWKVPWPI